MRNRPYTTIELARAAGVSAATVRRLARLGLLRYATTYRGWRRFPEAEVARVRHLLGWDIEDGEANTGPPERPAA
ncbi:MAG: MerR family transcriptional regulator [Candidatus Binatia bacterium]